MSFSAALLYYDIIPPFLFQCEEQCPYGSYGQGCGEQCRCKRGACDPVDGRCSCPPGWTGRGRPAEISATDLKMKNDKKIYLSKIFFSCWKTLLSETGRVGQFVLC